MTLHAREWKERYNRAGSSQEYPKWDKELYLKYKPRGCPLRRIEPKGPLQGCEEDCLAFEACVELARQEKVAEDRMAKVRERLDSFDA